MAKRHKAHKDQVSQLIAHSADPVRAESFWTQLLETEAADSLQKWPPEDLAALMALLAGSQALSEAVVAHPEWIDSLLHPRLLEHPRRAQGLRRDIEMWLKPALRQRNFQEAFSHLRLFRQREMIRIAARDLASFATVDEVIREISDLADVCLETVFRICWEQLTGKIGVPHHQEDAGWRPTAGTVLGMGKLGGQELNYSSDVDVLFVYSEEGFAFKQPPSRSEQGKGMTNHQFFNRLAEQFIAEVGRLTPEGMLYRIDLRLRPEGASGPLSRSLTSY